MQVILCNINKEYRFQKPITQAKDETTMSPELSTMVLSDPKQKATTPLKIDMVSTSQKDKRDVTKKLTRRWATKNERKSAWYKNERMLTGRIRKLLRGKEADQVITRELVVTWRISR
jgi:hypothetical protein